MKIKIFMILIIFAAFWVSQSRAEEKEVQRVQNYIAVMDIDLGKGIDPEFRALLTNTLINELVGIARFTVIDRANRDKILAEQGFQLSDCVDENCRVKVGRLLGVGKIVSGGISQMGDTYFGTEHLINVETGKIESSAMDKCEKCQPEDLMLLIKSLTLKLMGLPVDFSLGKGTGAAGEQPDAGKVKGGLLVKTDPPGAAVTLDGKPAGETPLTLANLPARAYQIEARKGEYYGRDNAQVVPDQFTTVTITMGISKSRLTIITEPPEADIYLDGKPAGKSPKTLADVSTGEHRIEAQAPGYLKTGETISPSGTDETVTISLVKGGTIKVNSDPPRARVEIGGKPVGSTPLEYLLPPGPHRVKVIGENCLPFESEVEMKAGEEQKVDAKLSYLPEYVTHLKKKRMTDNVISVSAISLAATGAGLAIFFNTRSYSNYDKYKKAVSQEKINYYWDHTRYDRNNMYVCLGVVGAGAVAAAIFWYLRPQVPPPPAPSPLRGEGKGEGADQSSRPRFERFQALVSPGAVGMKVNF